jgi:hypothetical protein
LLDPSQWAALVAVVVGVVVWMVSGAQVPAEEMR